MLIFTEAAEYFANVVAAFTGEVFAVAADFSDDFVFGHGCYGM